MDRWAASRLLPSSTRLMRFTGPESPQPEPGPESDIGALSAGAGDGLRGLIIGISGIMAGPASDTGGLGNYPESVLSFYLE